MSMVCCNNRYVNLASWAERNGVARVTAYRWFRAGVLPVPARAVHSPTSVVTTPRSTSHATRNPVSYTHLNCVAIESPHPSPLSASRGFFGSRPFSRANELLAQLGADPIDWRLP